MNEKGITDQLLKNGESVRVEFIEAPMPMEGVARAVCALLNSKGGVVVVGVDDYGRVSTQVSSQDTNSLRNFLHEQITPKALFTVSMDDTSSGPVISVDVHEGRDRPYVFEGTVYIRIGTHTRFADAEAMRGMVEERALEPIRWERRVATGLEISDLDRELLDETVRRAQDRRGYSFDNPRNADAVIADLSLSKFGQLTNAADVLFGQHVALRNPQTRLRAVCYATTKGEDFIDEQLFEGPIFTLLEQTVAFLKRHVAIAAEFKEGQLSRESRPQYPFNSMREGLVNALVHRDYTAFSGGVSVSLYPNRLEIWNSGRLPEGLTPGMLRAATHDSILVNPDISHVLYLHELMERVGRGTFKIVQECRELGTKLPEWRNMSSGVRLTLYAATASEGLAIELNERQQALLNTLAQGKRIVTREFLERFGAGVSERQARRDLSELEDAGYMKRIGAGPTTAYERTEKKV